MKHRSTRIALRWFFRLEIVCLCLTLAGVCTVIAAERTAYTALGMSAAVRTDSPVQTVMSRLPDKHTLSALASYAPLLPAPAGNLAGIWFSIRNIHKTDLLEVFGRLHNFFR